MRAISSAFVISALFLAACGSKGGGGGGTTEPTKTPAGPLVAGQWDSMDHEAREDFMKDAVLPAMAAAFKSFDAGEFGEFNCATCHGDGAQDDTFKMPNPGLPALSMEMIQAPDEDHKAVTEFMMNTVKPEMAKLLGKPEYSPENPEGFGCFHCHTMAP